MFIKRVSFSYLEVKPVISCDEVSRQEHFFKVVEVFHELGFEDGVGVEEGDEAVLRVPANVDDLAGLLEQGGREHAQRKVRFDDSETKLRNKLFRCLPEVSCLRLQAKVLSRELN